MEDEAPQGEDSHGEKQVRERLKGQRKCRVPVQSETCLETGGHGGPLESAEDSGGATIP